MRHRKYISDDDSPSSSSTELEIELSREAGNTSPTTITFFLFNNIWNFLENKISNQWD
jgi:hypothetical protein